MPSAASFRHAFGLEEGARLASPSSGWTFVLDSVTISHVEAQRHERYLFPTDLRVSCEKVPTQKRARSSKAVDHDAAATLRGVLERRLGTHHIVQSAYGSPYDCHFPLGKLRITKDKDGTLHVTVEGRATRRRDVPTSKQQADAKLTDRGTEGGDFRRGGKGQAGGPARCELSVRDVHVPRVPQ